MARAQPRYTRIVADLRARILSGELRPGDRLPSIRQLARQWGVAVATATRALATLRDDGLVKATVGSGTVVSAGRPAVRTARLQRALSHSRVVRTAIAIADVEGLDAVSMRRLTAELGVGPMSLYRHVANKDELVAHMADEVFGAVKLPDPGPDGWRPKLELIARRQWELCRRHLWLPRAVSLTRQSLVPNMMAQTEWTLRALDGLGLSLTVRVQEALTLHSLVVTVALSMAAEVEAEQETGMTLAHWWLTQCKRADDLLDGSRFPLLATVPQEVVSDLDGLFSYALARHLDGFAALVSR